MILPHRDVEGTLGAFLMSGEPRDRCSPKLPCVFHILGRDVMGEVWFQLLKRTADAR